MSRLLKPGAQAIDNFKPKDMEYEKTKTKSY